MNDLICKTYFHNVFNLYFCLVSFLTDFAYYTFTSSLSIQTISLFFVTVLDGCIP